MPYYMDEEKHIGFFESDEEAEVKLPGAEQVFPEYWITDSLFDENGINYARLKEYCNDPSGYVQIQMEEVLCYTWVENDYKPNWHLYDEIAEECTRWLLKDNYVVMGIIPCEPN